MGALLSKFPTHSGIVLPFNRRTTLRSSTVTPVANVDTVLATLDEIQAGNNPVQVHFTTNFTNGAGGGGTTTIQCRLQRDGVDVDAADFYSCLVEDGLTRQFHMHFIDETPGVNPIYSLVAVADVNAAATAGTRRLTAEL